MVGPPSQGSPEPESAAGAGSSGEPKPDCAAAHACCDDNGAIVDATATQDYLFWVIVACSRFRVSAHRPATGHPQPLHGTGSPEFVVPPRWHPARQKSK